MRRRVEDAPHRADLDETTRVHDGDPVAHARHDPEVVRDEDQRQAVLALELAQQVQVDRKSTRLNSSHSQISYAVFCLKKKKKQDEDRQECQDEVRVTDTDERPW